MKRLSAFTLLVCFFLNYSKAQSIGIIVDVIIQPLTAEGGDTFIELDWSTAPDFFNDITGYEISELVDDVEVIPIDELSSETTSYVVDGLDPDTEYTYRLTIFYGEDQEFSDDLDTGTLPNAPSGVTAMATSPVEISLTWTDNSEIENNFVIERRAVDEEEFDMIELTDPNQEAYDDESAAPITTYFYRIGAVGVSGTSYSSEVEVTTLESDIIFVDSDSEGGDGSSWGLAFSNIEDALEVAGNGDQIWVATRETSYQPGDMTGSTYAFSQISLELYGGFEGNEESLEERQAEAYTLLDGEIIDDNINNLMIISSPSHSTVIIDGFMFADAGDDFSDAPGAAINSSSGLHITNCIFERNTAATGGAIFISGEAETDLFISNSIFRNNRGSQSDGGAVYFNSYGNLSIEGSEFSSNSCGMYGGNGGAVYFSYGELDITSTLFNDNSAVGTGGALYALRGESNLEDVNFEINNAYTGGAIGFSGSRSSGSMTITDSDFTENTTDGGGGAIYANDTQLLTITSTDFIENFGGAEIGGGAIALDGFFTSLNLVESLFSANESDNDGGAIVFESNGKLTIDGGDFENNLSGDDGGAIEFGFGTASISGATFTGNTANGTGGAFYGFGGEGPTDIEFEDCVVETNRANGNDENGDGGGIRTSGLNLDVQDCEFRDNHSALRGGGIYHNNNNLSVDNTLFIGNSSNTTGGGINSRSAEALITNSAFSNNETSNRGGGIAVQDNASTNLVVLNTTFSGNSANTSGGGIHYGPENSTLELGHVTIAYNTANESGGGLSIFYEDANTTFLDNTLIAGNTAPARPDITANQQDEGPDILLTAGGIISDGHNLIGNLGGFNLTATTGDLLGTAENPIDPLLSELEEEDGTLVHPLTIGSPAINAGSIVDFGDEDILKDQRGVEYFGDPDIGAFEFDGPFSPELVGTQLSMTAIEEDDTDNEGDLLQNLVDGETDVITDLDGPGQGIAITSIDDTGGTWQYSLDNGSTWTDIGTPSTSEALLLPIDDDSRIRLVPALNFNGAIANSIEFKAWDQNDGEAGGTIDVSTFSDGSPFSEASGNISITVEAVNDAPTVANPIADQEAPPGTYSFTFPADVFDDVENGTNLNYSAEGLPDWLTLDAETRTFSGNAVLGTSEITLTAIDGGGATVADEFNLVINTVASVEDELERQVTLYPVPNYGPMNVNIQNGFVGEMSMTLVDQVGKSVFTQKFIKNGQIFNTQLDLSHLEVGIYFLRIDQGPTSVVKRLVRN